MTFNKTPIVRLLFFITSFAFVGASTEVSATTFYIAPNGNDTTGSGTYTSPWATTNFAYTKLRSGDTLVLKNGTYNGMVLLGRWNLPPIGTASAYTTIKGESFGNVIIDGSGDDNNGSTADVISIDGPPQVTPRYITISDIVAIHQTNGNIITQGDHIKLQRIGFEGAGDGNTAAFALSQFTSYILVEDAFAFGAGRSKFTAWHASNVVFRRCVVRPDRVTESVNSGNEMSGFSIYSSTNVEVQNPIVLDGDHPEFWRNVSYFGGAFHSPTTSGSSTNVHWRGGIALNLAMPFGELADNYSQIGTLFDNCAGWHLKGGLYTRAGDGVTLDHCTMGDLESPVNYGSMNQGFPIGNAYAPQNDTNFTLGITNSVLELIQGPAIKNFASEDYNVFYSNASDLSGTPSGAHSTHGIAPGIDYLIRIDAMNPLLHGTGSAGSDRGANILYKWGITGTLWGEQGYDQLTQESLWPWPYEDVIKRFMKSYAYTGPADFYNAQGILTTTNATLSGNRGFAADGNGLYGGPITLTSYIWEALGNLCPTNVCLNSTGTPTPTPTVVVSTPTPTSTPTNTPTPTPTSASVSGKVIATFDTLSAGSAPSAGYPAAGFNWSGFWVTAPNDAPGLTTQAISTTSSAALTGQVSSLPPGYTLTSLVASNGGSSSTTISIACGGNATVAKTLSSGQMATITTGWTNPCTNITFSISNGWSTDLDTLVFDPVGSVPLTPTPTITPLPTISPTLVPPTPTATASPTNTPIATTPSATPTPTPKKKRRLSATSLSANSVLLTWLDPPNPVTEYEIQKASGTSENFKRVALVPGGVRSFKLKILPKRSYRFRVRSLTITRGLRIYTEYATIQFVRR